MDPKDKDEIEFIATKIREIIREYWRGKIFTTAIFTTGLNGYEGIDAAGKAVKLYDKLEKEDFCG